MLMPGSDDARSLFPISEDTSFLNHASAAPLSTRVCAAMNEWITWWQRNGGREDMTVPLDQFRATLAALVGATPEEMAIVTNTSDGLLLVAQGYPWTEGDALLTAEGEFTANVYPWLAVQELGVEIIRLPTQDHCLHLEQIEQAMRDHPNIRLLALSFVGFATGFRNDLATLGNLCRQYEVHFCVDGIQGAGALPIDVEAMNIDFLAAGGPKWLMGPVGAGLFYCRRDLVDFLQPGRHGWLSTTDIPNFFRYDAPLSDTASRFEAGTLPWPSLHGLVASVETLLEVGVETIERYVLALGEALREGLTEQGYTVASPGGPGQRSGIVSFIDAARSAPEVVAHLDRHRVTVSARGPYVRVSPHFFNNLDDINALLGAMDRIS
jgi:cysteine desulfurase / selenocysteine lyase